MTIPQNPFQTDGYENILMICKILNRFNDSNWCSRTKIFKNMQVVILYRTSMPFILQSGTVRKPINKPLIWSDDLLTVH